MAKPVWNTAAGNLGTIQERTTQSFTLDASDATTYSLISGELPGGLRLSSNRIVGTPLEVPEQQLSEFVIRASNSEGAIDRTFNLIVEGEDPPLWLTPSGTLDIGPNGEYYIINNSPVDYQLSATDSDLTAGDELEFYFDDLYGELPPGLSMDKNGRITGILNAPLTIDYKGESNAYDLQFYDFYPYDYAGTADEEGAPPRYLSRYYQFQVTVSDGVTRERRIFRVFVIHEQQFRTDTTLLSVSDDRIISSATFLRAPIWTTTGNLGIRRANNYVTIPLEVYDPNEYFGNVDYALVPNADSTESILPTGMSLDTTNGVLFGKVPYQPAVTQSYTFTVRVTRTDLNTNEKVYSERQFTIKIQGEVDSTITFTSPTLLGTLVPNEQSVLQINATTTVTGASIRYNIVSGNLPPGLSLGSNGEIIGKVNQFADENNSGITTIDLADYGLDSFKLDGGTTTVDRTYRFTIAARDYFQLSAVEKEFRIAVIADTTTQYSNIFLQPFLSKNKRQYFYDFITDTSIFPEDSLYRANDPNFGTQTQIRMLLQHGIETETVDKYVPALSTNFHRKTFRFGDIKIANASDADDNAIYEVIYVDLIDDAENFRGSVPDRVPLNNSNVGITADTSKFKVSTSLITIDQLIEKYIYPNSVENMKKKLAELTPDGDSNLIEINETFLPLWMKSTQKATGIALGYTKAFALAYVKPGQGLSILENVQESGFDFKNIEFEIDRLVIDSVTGETGDKYIAFPKRKVI